MAPNSTSARNTNVRFRKRRSSPRPSLFPAQQDHSFFPQTRYQGSKLKLLDWIWASTSDLQFDTVLDLFGGTACVSYLFKTKGKEVTFNDILRSNYQIGKALIENSSIQLSELDVDLILEKHSRVAYDHFIEKEYHDIFFLPDENLWLDMVAQNIATITDEYKRALAYFALFQACLAKRPYNLFHRANLYIRTAEVKRSFGNKATWEKPFEEHFRAAVEQANRAVFDNGRRNHALNKDAEELATDADLVYIDTPYMNARGMGVDYLDFYHFLEGLTEYKDWPQLITRDYRHKPYKRRTSPWCDRKSIREAFDRIFRRFSDSILVVSYRDNGIPSPKELIELLSRYKRHVCSANNTEYRYVLSTTKSREILIIGK